jgi:16S rRNA (guanine527-N7)-methyltransferase
MPVPAGERDPDSLLVAGASALGLDLDAVALDRFRRFRDELVRWSARMSLTALRGPIQIVRHGFLDSLACTALLPPLSPRVVDIGSGAGFPAVPLAILRPDARFTLVEATRKKVTFLRHLVRTLQLPCVVINARAEALAQDPAHRHAYDVAFSRAVAPLAHQAALVRPFLRAGGAFLAQVGAAPSDIERLLEPLGFHVERTARLPADIEPGRHILVIRSGHCFT